MASIQVVIYSIITYLETLSGHSALLLYNNTLILHHTNVIRKPAQLFAYDFDNGNDGFSEVVKDWRGESISRLVGTPPSQSKGPLASTAPLC